MPVKKTETAEEYEVCPVVQSVRKVGNEWRLIVVRYLLDRPLRFNELLRLAGGVDAKTLSRVLKYLASEEIVRRDVLSTQPFIVQYKLTQKGEQLRPVIESLRTWGNQWVLPSIPVARK
ncbi:MAG: helix-turn-helix transcriptional regulator [Nitrososphaerota archaeon]|nr:helix-turn-helix transcriptional regulator [Nitrososphaerota archaeon]